MTRELSDEQARTLRLDAQQLGRDRGTEIDDAVRRVVGIQAQDAPAAGLSIRCRCPGISAADVDRRLWHDRSIVRTWALRGTLHVVSAEDVPLIVTLLGARFNRASRGRRGRLGLDDQTAEAGAQALEDLLGRRGPLTREEIRADPAMKHVPLHGQAAPHLIGYAALQGRICCGPSRDGEPTYVRLDDWISRADAPSEAQALAVLTRRYLRGYAPAAPEDVAAWSGLTVSAAREGFAQLADELAEVSVAGEPMWMLAGQRAGRPSADRIVRLLPKYDTLLMGYRSRDWVLPKAHAKRIFPGGGLIRRSILSGGRIVGTWGPKREGADRLRIKVDVFEDLSLGAREALHDEITDVARFLGRRSVESA